MRHRSSTVLWRALLAMLPPAGVVLGTGLAGALAVNASEFVRASGAAAGGLACFLAAVSIDFARGRKEAKAGAARERSLVLDRVVRAAGQDNSMLGVLLATRVVAPFCGRAADLAWLERWCDSPDGHPVAVVTGPGGTGKTRLVTQFASTRSNRWVTGWLRPGCGGHAIAAMQTRENPALILVDDADSRSDLQEFLENLAHSPDSPVVRVILIARSADWPALISASLHDSDGWILGAANTPILSVGLFGSTDDHARWFTQAVSAYAAALKVSPPDLPDVISRGEAKMANEPIVALQAKALLAVLDTESRRPLSRMKTMPFNEVAEGLIKHEQRRWNDLARQPELGLTDLTAPIQERAIAVLTSAGVASESDAVAALSWISDLVGANAERLGNIARWAFRLYPPETGQPMRMQPSMLAEWFLVTKLTQTPEIAGHLRELSSSRLRELLTVFAGASDHMPQAVSLFANVIAADTGALAAVGVAAALNAGSGRPALDSVLASLIASASWSESRLTEVAQSLPARVLPRTRAAMSSALVDLSRNEKPEVLADALRRHEIALRALGYYREALNSAEETLGLFRGLAANDPAHQHDVARALDARCTVLRNLGRYQEALDDAEEALGLFREMATDDPAYQHDVADLLHSRAISFNDLGQYKNALADQAEALVIFRRITADDPAHQHDVAKALDARCTVLRNLGRYQEALDDAEEALGLFREMATDDPVHQQDVAGALLSRASSFNDLGDYERALADNKEALIAFRELAADSPVYEPDVACSLGRYATNVAHLGRDREATSTTQEALRLYRTLSIDNPVHKPEIAGLLNNLGINLRNLERYSEALRATEEALKLFRALSAERPGHQRYVAGTLVSLSSIFYHQGRYPRALAAIQEALGLYRNLAAENPANNSDLAATLVKNSVVLECLGRRSEALGRKDEAREVYATLTHIGSPPYELRYLRSLSGAEKENEVPDGHAVITPIYPYKILNRMPMSNNGFQLAVSMVRRGSDGNGTGLPERTMQPWQFYSVVWKGSLAWSSDWTDSAATASPSTRRRSRPD